MLREILDRELTNPSLDSDIQEAFAALADGYENLAGDLFDDDPDLRIER